MRKPQYTTDNQYRIVSLPGNLWRLQENKDGARGTKTNDPWQNRSLRRNRFSARISRARRER